jgi:hypothetical protein
VLVSCENEDKLLDIADVAHRDGLQYTLINEPDWEGNPHTAIALEPTAASRKLCANLPLALKELAMVS